MLLTISSNDNITTVLTVGGNPCSLQKHSTNVFRRAAVRSSAANRICARVIAELFEGQNEISRGPVQRTGLMMKFFARKARSVWDWQCRTGISQVVHRCRNEGG